MFWDVKNILCCVAMGPQTEWVMLRALQEARVHDAQVHVLHVIPAFDAAMATPIVSFMGEEKFNKLVDEHKEETAAEIKQEIEDVKNRIITQHLGESVDRIRKIHVFEGDPEVKILQMADDLDVDMIVVGTHSKKINPYTFTGSVAKKVIRGARIPLLLVPPEASRKPGNGGIDRGK